LFAETIYKNRRLLNEKGHQALKQTYRSDIHHKNRTAKDIKNIVISFSLENPHLGQVKVSPQLKIVHQVEISPAGVRNVWVRENMSISALRYKELNYKLLSHSDDYLIASLAINC
jgi:hypothetical protein